jgi:hypothetical protein
MAQQNLSDDSTWPVEKPKIQANFTELYARKYPAATGAANDFSVGNGSVWQTKTLAETKVILAVPDELADLTADATHRTVTDTEKATWNGKASALLGEVNAPTTGKEFSLSEMTRTIINNDGQNPDNDIAQTTVALVAGLEFDIVIAEAINSTHYWQITFPSGTSVLYGNTMGSSGGHIRFTAAAMGDRCHCKTMTINTGVIILCESSATSISVT